MHCSIIPGNSSSKTFEANHHKPQRFIFRNGLKIEEGTEKKIPKVSEAERLLGRNAFRDSNPPVLTFKAYYCEPVGERNTSSTRFRKCNVLFYLADDEIKVFEPRQKNSGLDQGCIVGKGRFYKPSGGYYTVSDLNVGETLLLFGREYKLIDCDAFTRKFLTEMGFRVRSPEPDIEDPVTQDREEANVPKSYRRPYVKEYKYKNFFKYHPKALRFYGYYGDGKNLFEEKREVTLYYDLSNGKIQINEERCKSKWIDGRSDTRVLLRSTLVPKVVEPSLLIGEMCNPTLLTHVHDVQNVLIGGRYYKIQNTMSYLVDGNPLEGRKKNVEYYTDHDLDLGITLNIFGNDVFLHDCDDFTKNYYLSTYNKEMKPVPRPEVKLFPSHKLIYEHEIFGEPEQSIRTNDPFQPIRCMTVLKKFFKNDRYGYDVRELKFLARMVSEDPVEKRRVFLLRWFLGDNTMDIRTLDIDFENSGVIEHKFFKRMRVIKPRSSVGNFERCYYEPSDMFVGNILYVRGRAYSLIDADEYTYDYMERNCHQFLHSNIKRIVTTLRPWAKDHWDALQTKFRENDPQNTGRVTYDDFKNIMWDAMCSKEMLERYPEHALRTLARHYAEDKYTGLRWEDLASRIRTELYRARYYDFEDLRTVLEIHDEEKSGYLTQKRLYFVLRSSSIPLNRDLIKSFAFKFPSKEGRLKYLELLDSIDWLKNPAPLEKEDPSVININWEHAECEKDMQNIDYNSMLTELIVQ